MKSVEKVRKSPTQNRSRDSVGCILEAAAQILETDGETGFTTNAVAERAGVSIGTLYRYFPDKGAILLTLAERETEIHRRAAIAAATGEAPAARDRALIRSFVGAFARRDKARRIAMKAMLAEADHAELASRFAEAEAGITDAEGRPLTRIQAFVLARAIHGALRAAVLEGADFLQSREFEDELVRLSRSYLGFRSAAAR